MSFDECVKINEMKEIAIRLKRGMDLKKEIESLCKDGSYVVLSSVGCLSHLHIRLAKAQSELDLDDDFEILSLNGTISNGKAHLHICVADDKGKCLGGHLKQGCLINTTCELVLGKLEEYSSRRVFDEMTGYDEIMFDKQDR